MCIEVSPHFLNIRVFHDAQLQLQSLILAVDLIVCSVEERLADLVHLMAIGCGGVVFGVPVGEDVPELNQVEEREGEFLS